jgi:hypothetical protein
VRLLAYVPFGQALGLLWGFVILAVLVVRIRVMMQASLLEAAVEDAVRTDGLRSKRATVDDELLPRVREPPARQLQLLHGVRHLRPVQQPPGAAGHERTRGTRGSHGSHGGRRRMTEQPPQDPAAQPRPSRPVQPAYAPAPPPQTGVRAGARSGGPARLRLPAGRDPGRSRAHGAGRVGRVLLVEPRQDDRADRGRVVAVGALGGIGAAIFGGDDEDAFTDTTTGGTVEPGEEVTPEPDGGILSPSPIGSATPEPSDGPSRRPARSPRPSRPTRRPRPWTRSRA